MTDREQNEQRQRQITTLLDYPGIGALAVETIARNMGVSVEEIHTVLDAMVAAGQLARRADDRFARPDPVRDGRADHRAQPRVGI